MENQLLLFVSVILISFVFSNSPGDPFADDFDDYADVEHITNKTISLLMDSLSTALTSTEDSIVNDESSSIHTSITPIDETISYTYLFPSTVNPAQERLPIYKKHLTQIAQWKYTDPATHETRYWYHTVGSVMGDGWIPDGILCQAYTRQKLDTIPIHGYHSELNDIWTNTLQTQSTVLPVGNNQWKYDGTLFYAYKTSMNSSLLKPVWRYWNRINYGTEDVGKPRRSYLRIGDVSDEDIDGWKAEELLFFAFLPDVNLTHSEYYN